MNSSVTAADTSVRKHALVVGATGVIGRHIAAELAADWTVSGIAHSFPPEFLPHVQQLQADLLNPRSIESSLQGIGNVSHVFYCAYKPAADWDAATESNAAMFSNVLAQVAASDHLERVVLITGTKVYGVHQKAVLTPILESDPRHAPPNFYFNQADALMAAQHGRRWSWTELRPHTLCGLSPGTPMSLATILAVYGAVCRELRVPMRFPGSQRAYEVLYQVTDAALFGRAARWAATSADASNQAFNITNGEGFRWQRMWALVARSLGVQPGPPSTFSLQEFMSDKAPVWEAMVARHGLKPYRMDQLANWQFADYALSNEWDILSSTTKARLHGFTEAVDSAAMFARLFDLMRKESIIP